MTKQAFEISPQARRMLGHAAMGTAGGALLGGVTADPEHRVRGALQGGAIGGLAAGGVSALSGGELADLRSRAESTLAAQYSRTQDDLRSILHAPNGDTAKFIALDTLGHMRAQPPKIGSVRDAYGFEHAVPRDVYGFQKRAWGEMDDVAYQQGFHGPSYSNDPGTPVEMAMVNPSTGERAVNGVAGGAIGGMLGALGGGGIGRSLSPRGTLPGMALGGLAGAAAGGYAAYKNTPKQLMLRPWQQAQVPTVDPKDLAAHMTPEQQAQMAEGIRTGHGGIDNRPKQAAVTDDQMSATSILPFGSSYMGYQRGKMTGNGGEGLARGFAGGMLGGGGGAALGRVLGPAGAGLGALAGTVAGTHYATRGMLPSVQAAQQAAKDYKLLNSVGTGARTFGHELAGSQDGRRALGAMAGVAGAGMLGAGAAGYNAMRGGGQPQQPKVAGVLGRMGKVLNVAGQRAGNMYNVEREMFGSGVGNALVQGARTGVGSMMNSQTGRGMLGAGAGLAGAGVLGAGAAGYNALKTRNDQVNAPMPATVARQALGAH